MFYRGFRQKKKYKYFNLIKKAAGVAAFFVALGMEDNKVFPPGFFNMPESWQRPSHYYIVIYHPQKRKFEVRKTRNREDNASWRGLYMVNKKFDDPKTVILCNEWNEALFFEYRNSCQEFVNELNQQKIKKVFQDYELVIFFE